MLQLWVMALFAAVYAREPLGELPMIVQAGWFGDSWERWSVGLTLGSVTASTAVASLLTLWARRRLERTGSVEAVALADRVQMLGRLGIVASVIVGVIALGWLDVIRGQIGDVVAVDELLALLPAGVAIAVLWWVYYPIDRRLRESVLMRTLDDGGPAYPVPTRGQFVWSNVRHQILMAALPLAMAMTWIETINVGHDWLERFADAAGRAGGWEGARYRAGWLARSNVGQTILGVVQVLGIAGVFLVAPAAMRIVWDTIPLRSGATRDRLLALCRAQGVRVRDLLVWRTHGTMANGAVMGVLGRLRYILLTDVLLDSLREREIEAVMAHEVAHVRRKHFFWLPVALIAAAGLAGWAGDELLRRTGAEGVIRSSRALSEVAQLVGVIATFGIGITALGFVSRRFEWQADAFAAAHLSRFPPAAVGAEATAGGAAVVTEEAAGAMAGALESVARLNHVPRAKPSWRHGSIAERQARLASLVGQPVDGMEIDRTVRWVKRAAGLAFLLLIALAMWTSR